MARLGEWWKERTSKLKKLNHKNKSTENQEALKPLQQIPSSTTPEYQHSSGAQRYIPGIQKYVPPNQIESPPVKEPPVFITSQETPQSDVIILNAHPVLLTADQERTKILSPSAERPVNPVPDALRMTSATVNQAPQSSPFLHTPCSTPPPAILQRAAQPTHLKSAQFNNSLPNLASFLKLPNELICQIASILDYSSTIILKYSCKHLNRIIEKPLHLPPSHSDTLTLQKLFPSKLDFARSRHSSYHCKDCGVHHSFEHMIIWPHSRPESSFQNFNDYALQSPRVCMAHALRSGRWIPGQRMNADYILCEKCLTPRDVENKCAWNCQRCGICVRRKIWSGFCVQCWKPGDGSVMRYVRETSEDSWGGRKKKKKNKGYLVEKKNEQEKICGRCLGRLGHSEGSVELCCCNESRNGFSLGTW